MGNRSHPRKLAITVLLAPAFLTLLPAIVRDTAVGGLALAVGVTATERTPQIPASRIARIREKENAAMPTAREAAPQPGMRPQRPAQDPIVLLDQIGHYDAAIPIRTKLEMRLDLDC
jgi:hypothetical protein